jgi:FAD:protein FMN transferase
VTDEFLHTFSAMGTVVTLHVVGHGATATDRRNRDQAVARAATWFDEIERTCSRFDPSSELRRLTSHVGESVAASSMLVEAVAFALAVARESDGAFDPTVGLRMERRGFDIEHRSGRRIQSDLTEHHASWRDVRVDQANNTITLACPLVLDLGAVAKGMAVDMAARELSPFVNFVVDAGGDAYFGGYNVQDDPWSVGIRHPRREDALMETLRISDCAVCTSGDYERVTTEGHHILDPVTREAASQSASVTVVTSSAMVADALATAAFVLGPDKGIPLLQRHEVDGLIVTPDLERFETGGMSRYRRGLAAT